MQVPAYYNDLGDWLRLVRRLVPVQTVHGMFPDYQGAVRAAEQVVEYVGHELSEAGGVCCGE